MKTKNLARASTFEHPEIDGTESAMFINSLARGMDILRAYQEKPGPLSNKELVAFTGLTKGTVSRLTYTLTRLGYLIQCGTKYDLSPQILTLSYPYLLSQKVRNVGYPYLAEIAEQGVYSLALAVPNGHNMVYILEAESQKLNALRLEVGVRIEMVKTALGRAYLGGLNDDQLHAIYSQLMHVYGDEWPEWMQRIEKSRSEVQSAGFCLVEQEWRTDMRSVAVPVYSNDGTVKAAVNCTGPTFAVSRHVLKNDIGPRLTWISEQLASYV